MKIDKHKLKTQLILATKAFKGTPGFHFYDSLQPKQGLPKCKLDDNDKEVLFMKLKGSDWILLTTKAIFLGQCDATIRIDGANLERYKFANKSDKKGLLSFGGINDDTKRWMHSGEFIIVRKDGSEERVVLPNHHYGFCLIKAISKMKFLCGKYAGV